MVDRLSTSPKDSEKRSSSTDPYSSYSLLSQLTLWWGRSSRVPADTINVEFVKSLPTVVSIKTLAERLSAKWNEEVTKRKPDFGRALVRQFWRKYFWYMIPFILMACGQLAVAVTMTFLTRALADSSASDSTCYLLALAYSLVTLLSACMITHGFQRALALGSLIKMSISTVIYNKTLTLSSQNLSKPEVHAKLTHLLGSDLDVFDVLCVTMFLFITPFFVVISTPVLWYLVGPAGIVAEVVTLCTMPAKWYLNKCVSNLTEKCPDFAESRIKSTQSLIEGIKSIKMYSIETPLVHEIQGLKAEEHKGHLLTNILRNFTATFLVSGGQIVTLVLLTVLIALDEELIAADIFGAASILFSMNMWANFHMSWGLELMITLRTLMRNITEIMLIPSDNEERQFILKSHDVVIKCENVTATWNDSKEHKESDVVGSELVDLRTSEIADVPLVLTDLNVSIRRGQLCMVIGTVGSGKSSLLQVLAGVLKPVTGTVHITNSVGYVESEPWIIAGTVKDNITLGHMLIPEMYDRVVDVCGLRTDLEQFPQGDQTLIGDTGSNLSGGQRARIALARAVYHDKDVYLLDDPLSAVDANVGAHIFNKCILEQLRGKTRILVTNQHKLLPHADVILVFRSGKLVVAGQYSAIKDTAEFQASVIGSVSTHIDSKETNAAKSSEGGEEKAEYVNEIMEEKEEGSVPISVYIHYFLLFFKSKLGLLVLFLVILLVHAVYLGTSYWISYWTEQGTSEQQANMYPAVLAGFVVTTILACVLHNLMLLGGMSRANLSLHNQAIQAVTHTDLSFFDLNPIGRILARFTKDCWVMEELFLRFYSEEITLFFFLIGYMLAMVVTVPQNLPVMVAVFVLVVLDIRRYVPSTRKFKRVELSIRGDIIGHLNTSIRGITGIRIFGLFDHFTDKFDQLLSAYFQSNFCYSGNIQTFEIVMELIGVLFVTINVFISVILRESISPSVAAVNFSFTVMINIALDTFAFYYVHAGAFMISGHRLYEYTKLREEKDEHTETQLQVTNGDIEFRAVDMRYHSSQPLVLNHTSFFIPGGSKVGLIGRTGSGKSSILQTLFRLREITSGAILIDGVDISQVSLVSLRSQLNSIPQHPLLFHGSVLDNLTMYGTYSIPDAEKALHDVGLEARESVYTLSTGQKQLLCLARAFLSKAHIVFFDEPTGNIDPKTQDFVVDLVKRRFQGHTVITIAHRLKTIMDNDRVMVLEAGEVVESGVPSTLVKTQGSRFKQLSEMEGISQ